MAKATSPVRLQQELMDAATRAGAVLHRSAAEQVEYWAAIGRQVAHFLTGETLVEVAAGLARLTVEPTPAPPIEPSAVFAQLERDRESGELVHAVTTVWPRYQAAPGHPGCLEQIQADGTHTLGHFVDGAFAPLDQRTR